jgi:hypothetical protein
MINIVGPRELEPPCFFLGGELEGADTQDVLREGLLFFSRFWRMLVSFVLRFCVEPREGSRGRLLMSF